MTLLWIFQKKIFKKFTFLKKRILQKQSLSQLNDQIVFAIMNVVEKFAYNSKNSTNKIFKTLMFSLKYDDLIKNENIQWNIVVMSNNFQCDNKFSTFKFDVYLIYSRDAKFSWIIKKKNNVVNHFKIRSYFQLTKRNTFSFFSLKLKIEFVDEMLITTKTQIANNESHFVNSML